MADHDNSSGANPKEEAILRLIQERIATKLDQIEKEHQAHDSLLSTLKTEIDGLTEVGANIHKELEEHEAQRLNASTGKPGGLGVKIDVDDDAGRTITAPLSTREAKTNLLGGKNPAADPKNRRLSHQGNQGKSDKPTSLTDVAEETKKEVTPKPGKKPVTTPAANTRPAKTDKPPGKVTDTKKAGAAHDKEEEKKEHAEGAGEAKEKTPEQAAADEGKQALKNLKKDVLTEAASLPNPPPSVAKVLEATLLALGEKSHTWKTAQGALKSVDFTKKLTNLDVLNIPVKNFVKVRQIMAEEGMDVENLAKKNAAAKHIGQWLHSIIKVREIAKGHEEAPEEPNAGSESERGKKEHAEEQKENTEPAEPEGEKTPEQTITDSIKALNKKVLTEAASLPSPPTQVIKAFEAALVAIGEKSQTWITAQKVAKAADFAKRLTDVKPEAINDKNYKKIKQILGEEGMQPDAIAKKNIASKHLVQWLQAVITLREQAKGTEETAEKTEEKAESKAEIHEEEKKEHTENADENKEKTPEQAALDEAKQGLNSLTKAALTEAASLSKPPDAIVKIFEAVLLALGEKTQTWSAAQKLAKSTGDFLNKLLSLDILTIPAKNFKKIKQIMSGEGMQVENLAKKSAAAKQIGHWLHGLIKYREIVKGEEAEEHAEEAEPEVKTPAPPKKGPTATTTTKKDDKKDDKAKDKDAEKKAPVPKTPAATTKATKDKEDKKTDDKKDDKKTTTTTKAAETKKPELQHANPELKTIIESLSASDVTDLKAKKSPAAPILSTLQAVTLLIQGKELQWADITKNVLHDIASLYKVLDVDAHGLVQKNVDAANKKLSDKTLEAGVHKAGEATSTLFKWAKAAIKLAQEKGQPAGEAPANAEHKEEAKQEEEKPATEQTHAEPEKKEPEPEHKEEHPTEEAKPAEPEAKAEEHHEEQQQEPAKEEQHEEQQQPAVEEHHEEQPPKEEEQPAKEEEQPAKEEQAEEAVQEEHKQGEASEEHKVEESQPQEEAQATNGDHVETNHVVAEDKAEEAQQNGDAHNKEAEAELSSVLGHDVSGEIQGDLKGYLNKKIEEADNEAKAVERQNEDFRKENVPENPERKPYEIKQSTKEFIQMVQQEWVHELKANENWDEKIYQILDLLFLVQGNPDVPSLSDHGKVRSYAISKLEEEESDLGGYLMRLEQNLNLDTARKVQIQEFLKDKTAILNPSSFDGVDALCGVISFLMKEACEYLGVIPVELAKKAAAKEKIYLLNQEKSDYLANKKNKLNEIAHKYGISLDE